MRTGPMNQFWANDKPRTLPIAEDLPQLFVTNLGQRRIHHDDEPDRNRDIGCAHLEAVNKGCGFGDEMPHRDSNRHG